MSLLKSPISSIPNVGPKYTKLLKSLNIVTLEDLLWHIPFRYDDYTNIQNINEVTEDKIVTVEAVLQNIENIYTKNRKRLTKGKVVDLTGTLEVVWFNQHYLIKSLKVGKKYTLRGKVQKFNSKLTLVAPTYENLDDGESKTKGKLLPVYNLTGGLSSKWIRTRINDVLNITNLADEPKEFLPSKTIKKQDLLGINEAINNIHFPKDENEIITAKKRLEFEELLIELLKVENRKHTWKENYEGVPINQTEHKGQITDLQESLPFKLTNSQNKVISEIFDDLATKAPMNRLLEGDVGSGKTIVAIFAAYLAHLSGYKTLYMAPTEILAKQHLETFEKFLGPLGINIELKTGSSKTSPGSIIIGTHALLYDKAGYSNVGLIIIDEQHRFGVEQRAKILKMGTGDKVPNLLTMTATPIPRTLALTLYGDLDLSVLDEVPNIGKKITTKVVTDKYRETIFNWIKSGGEQTFVVCPFIEESGSEMLENVKAAQKEYENLKNGVFSDVSVGLLHGRMKSDEKQKVMQDFREGIYRVLVSTPVVEVGVDIPDAVVMVIESAERYGLASLHQLRGRVGRGHKQGHCFLFMSGYSKKAYARLKNLENIDSGLLLAEIDMEFRGRGDVFGTMQHGIKQFKVANINDLGLLEKVKLEAQELYTEINEYPLLKQKVSESGVGFVGSN
jgi:ATP-dependent DNA helicase RecG